jgi:hypothetical protein
MPDEKKEEEKPIDPIDDYLRVSGRQETAPMTFADLKAVKNHRVAPPEEEESEPAQA